ncbi:MAG: enoyl-CoA hydratase-related protein [Alphaproteobacteria bacterium]|nr:enoyl-CoA hydratase-related protein [Alphaproteobacteria bacterium]
MSAEVVFEMRAGILIITFNRPANGNALTTGMAKTLHEKLKGISEDRSVRCVVLRGAGGCFMDGHELSGFKGDPNAVQDQIFQRIQFFFTSIRELATMEKPVVCAVDGHVSGAGISMMLASDFVVSSKRTMFNTDFTRYATIPDGGATFFLPRKIGVARANELLYLTEDFSAEKAEHWHLVNKVVPDDQLASETLAFAEKLAKGPTRTLGATKRLMLMAFEQDIHAQLALESSTWTAISKTFDFREGMNAYQSKREPKYTGA